MRLAPVGAVLAMALVGCGSDRTSPPCTLETELAARAGAGAVDCGQAAIDAGAASVDSCLLGAFNRHEPFIAKYRIQGIDTDELLAVAGDGAGKVTLIRWSSDPFHHPSEEYMRAESCGDPFVGAWSFEGQVSLPITCTSTTSLPAPCR